MIYATSVTEPPQELLENLSEMSAEGGDKLLDGFIKQSFDNLYIKDEDKPLILIGAIKWGNFSPEADIWFYTSKFFSVKHARTARAMWLTWARLQKETLTAHCKCSKSRRFLEFNDFKFREVHNGIYTYEAQKWA